VSVPFEASMSRHEWGHRMENALYSRIKNRVGRDQPGGSIKPTPDLVLKHPHEHATAKTTAVLVGGPALYLIGNLLFKWVTAGWPPLSHLVGLALLIGLVPVAAHVSVLSLGAATSLVLVVVAAWETISLQSEGRSRLEDGG
jgi:hypothetical protein